MRRLTPTEIEETIYRLDGPLRWALGEATHLVRKAGVAPGDTVLDVGAGTGYLSLPLARAVRTGGEVHCVDVCEPLLEHLEAKARAKGLAGTLRLRSGSALSLHYPDAVFDAVFCTYLLHELGDDAVDALREMHRVLKPLGRLVIADFRRIEDPERLREIEHWYGAQDDGGGREETHLRFAMSDVERMLREIGFVDIEISTWMDFHMHALATT